MYDQFGNLTPAGQQYFDTYGVMPPRGGMGFGQSMDPKQLAKRRRSQGVVRTGAGLVDVIQGRQGQRLAEEQIDELGAQQEELVQQFKDLQAPGLMDPNTVAAATRNAAILGGVPSQPDNSAELAAAQMAMEAGSDPATIQRNLAAAQQAEAASARNEAQQTFQQGLGFAQADAQNQYAKDRENLMYDMDDICSSWRLRRTSL